MAESKHENRINRGGAHDEIVSEARAEALRDDPSSWERVWDLLRRTTEIAEQEGLTGIEIFNALNEGLSRGEVEKN